MNEIAVDKLRGHLETLILAALEQGEADGLDLTALTTLACAHWRGPNKIADAHWPLLDLDDTPRAGTRLSETTGGSTTRSKTSSPATTTSPPPRPAAMS